MSHIDANHGRFVTILSANRNEVVWFTNWIQDHEPTWSEARRRPARRHGDRDEVWQTFESPLPSDAGYRVIWVHSNSKQVRDAATREAHIEAALRALDALSLKLAGSRCRLKSVVAVETAVADALDKTGATRYFATHVEEVSADDFRQAQKGRPGPDTRYAKTTKMRFALSFAIRTEAVSADAKSDGMFPLVTNDRVMTGAEVLDAYKYQPNLERRHGQLKGHQQVAPMYLKDPVRIEGLLCCHFCALIVQALIEREIRGAMKAANTIAIALYPELRDCTSPSAERILEIFAGVSRHVLRDGGGQVLKIFEPRLDRLQLQVLELLGIPQSAYTLAKSTPK